MEEEQGYLNGMMYDDNWLPRMLKRAGSWMGLGWLAAWLFGGEPVVAALGFFFADVLALSPIAYWQAKAAFLAQEQALKSVDLAELAEIGRYNQELAESRGLEIAKITSEIGQISAQNAGFFEENTRLKLAEARLTNENNRLKLAEARLTEENTRLKLAEARLTEESARLKLAEARLAEAATGLEEAKKELNRRAQIINGYKAQFKKPQND
jgi:hypothetical protein